MKIKLLSEYKYCENGVTIKACGPGEHDLPDRFALSAVKDGYGKRIGDDPGSSEKSSKPERNKAKTSRRTK